MQRSYERHEVSERAMALAREITMLLVDSHVTYQEAMDAVEAAQELLETTTRPVMDKN